MKDQIISLIEEKENLIKSLAEDIKSLKNDLIVEYGIRVGDIVRFIKDGEIYAIHGIDLWEYKPRYNLTLLKKDGSIPLKAISPKYYVERNGIEKIENE